MTRTKSIQVLGDNLSHLLATQDVPRISLAQRMGVGDGTLGRIKYGTANPTIDVVDRIAQFFRIEPWMLLQPGGVTEVAENRGRYVKTTNDVAQTADELTLLQRFRTCSAEKRAAILTLMD